MINIKGNTLVTFTATAGEIYCIQYETNHAVNIANLTEGDIYVSSDGVFDELNGVGGYIIIPSGGGYNDYNHIYTSNKLFIKADEDGKVSVASRR